MRLQRLAEVAKAAVVHLQDDRLVVVDAAAVERAPRQLARRVEEDGVPEVRVRADAGLLRQPREVVAAPPGGGGGGGSGRPAGAAATRARRSPRRRDCPGSASPRARRPCPPAPCTRRTPSRTTRRRPKSASGTRGRKPSRARRRALRRPRRAAAPRPRSRSG